MYLYDMYDVFNYVCFVIVLLKDLSFPRKGTFTRDVLINTGRPAAGHAIYRGQGTRHTIYFIHGKTPHHVCTYFHLFVFCCLRLVGDVFRKGTFSGVCSCVIYKCTLHI